MIILCGIPSEAPVAMVSKELTKMGVPYAIFNQRNFANIEMDFEISKEKITGFLKLEERSYRLEDIYGVYLRLMDYQLLPELKDEPPNSPKQNYSRILHETLVNWCEITHCRVVNRSAPMASGCSKPYQAQIIRKNGFLIPETLITNDPELVQEFLIKHKKIIYKSISGIRSIVQTLNEKDLERIDSIRGCPIQFQEFIEGTIVSSIT
ncbi:MAG: hypothetical protein AB1397_02700 [bacterium]